MQFFTCFTVGFVKMTNLLVITPSRFINRITQDAKSSPVLIQLEAVRSSETSEQTIRGVITQKTKY